MRSRAWSVGSVGVVCLLAAAVLRADTLVMKDGRRVDCELVAVRDGVIEFIGQRGLFGGRERMRIDRADVRRIELDDLDRGDRFDRGGDRDRDDRRDERPSGMRERTVSVDSWTAWNDTGVDVRSGQTVYFEASGRVRWGPGRQDTPEGERNSPYNANRPIPNRPAAALIGRVGEGSDYFFIGDDNGPVRMRSSGRLFLGINDDFLKDNSGSFRVVVYY